MYTDKILLLNHDLKNYLLSAFAFIELLEIEDKEHAKKDHLKTVKQALLKSADKLHEISTLLHTARDVASTPSTKPTLINSYIADEAKNLWNELKMVYPIEIITAFHTIDTPRYCECDMNKLEMFRENFVSNAFKAEATQLIVKYIMTDDYLVLEIRDNGKGMTQKEIDKFLLKNHGNGVTDGIGSRYILSCVQEHNFSITVKSQLNKGTTFRVLMPYIAEPS